jgi:hypothetical protein
MVEVLDRILDKGIVIDAEVRVALAGVEFANVEARIVVAGIETYLENADLVSTTPPAWWREISPARPEGTSWLSSGRRSDAHETADGS